MYIYIYINIYIYIYIYVYIYTYKIREQLNGFKRVCIKIGSSQDQNLDLTVLFVQGPACPEP
jgi:hypothetical protein